MPTAPPAALGRAALSALRPATSLDSRRYCRPNRRCFFMSTRQPEVRTALPQAPPPARENQSAFENVGQHFRGAEPRGGAGGSGLSPARRQAACAPSSRLGARGLGRGPRRLPRRPWESRPRSVGLQGPRGPWVQASTGPVESQNDPEVTVHLSCSARPLASVLQAGVWAEGCMPSPRAKCPPLFRGYCPCMKRKISV